MIKFELCKYNEMLPKDLKDFYCIRKKIFKDKLDWLVKCVDGMEFDEYDNDNTSYLTGKIEGKIICGCRFIDMNLQNMCTGVFYKYFNNMQILKGNYVEVTRIFIDKDNLFDYRRLQNVRLNFYLNIYNFAKEAGYEGVYAVVTKQLLSSLIRAGWKVMIQQQGVSEKNERIYLIVMPTNDKTVGGLMKNLHNSYPDHIEIERMF
ncbi:acyl-homoserine-lactone synthase [Cedecea sp.]|uniref:acyl-homoserine-lactone synthase n=1 Tax=Cedecea sp. TaxID=1970739 RepID=UPI002F42BF77